MTIEFSLRRRAKRARHMAVFWLGLATIILVGTCISLPHIAKGTLNVAHATVTNPEEPKTSVAQNPSSSATHNEVYAIGVLSLSLASACFACFLIGRTAFVEIELAARFVAFADALCLAGDNVDQFEKFANILLPGTKYLSVPEIFSIKDLDSVVELVKQLRPK